MGDGERCARVEAMLTHKEMVEMVEKERRRAKSKVRTLGDATVPVDAAKLVLYAEIQTLEWVLREVLKP